MAAKMRVLMLTTSYPKYSGETTAPFIEEIAAGLAARGHTIRLVAPWHPDIRRAPTERGVALEFFPYAPHPALNIWGYAQSLLSDTQIKRRTLAVLPFALAGTLRALQQALARDHFDLIHAHWVLPNGLPAALIARLRGLPLVISLHGSDVYIAEQHWALAGAAGLTFRAAAAVTACSSDLHRRGIRLGSPPLRSRVIPYGVDAAQFRPDPAQRAQVRRELGLASDAPLVLGLGRLVAKKGFGTLLAAWPAVLTQVPDAQLVIGGYGDLQQQLEVQARELGISARVTFPGRLERQRAAAYVAAADVFTLPIVRDQGTDGLPNALLEAMSAGRPIVASRVAGVPDVIEDECQGLLVPEREPMLLATAITRLLRDRALATRLGAAARARIESDLTWDHTTTRFEQVYVDCLQAAEAFPSRIPGSA